MTKLSVVCVKWGNKYGPEYVNRLYDMVKKNLYKEFTFYCHTEDPTGINPEIIILPIVNDELESWWHKMTLFKRGFLSGRVLYLDLDVVIQRSIDCFVGYKKELTGVYTHWSDILTDNAHMFATLRNKTPFNSSVMVWNAEDYYWVWDKFEEDIDGYIFKYYGDDKFLGNEVENKFTFPRGWVYSRLGGLSERFNADTNSYNDVVKDSEGNPLSFAFHLPRARICLLNGPTTEDHYRGLSQYF
jgi:hypothetical protein